MTCKLSSNFFLALSPPRCLRHCREGAVTGALKCSPSDQQLRGVGGGGGCGGEGGGCKRFLGQESVSEFVPVCLYSAHAKVGKVQNQIDCYHSCLSLLSPSLSLFVPSAVCSSRARLHSVWSTALWCFAPD